MQLRKIHSETVFVYFFVCYQLKRSTNEQTAQKKATARLYTQWCIPQWFLCQTLGQDMVEPVCSGAQQKLTCHQGHHPWKGLMLFHKKRFYKRARLAPVSLSGFLSHHVIPFAHAPTMADIIYHDDLTKDQTYETTQPWTFSLQNCEITLLKSTPTSSTFVIATKNRTIQPLKSPCQKLPLLVI